MREVFLWIFEHSDAFNTFCFYFSKHQNNMFDEFSNVFIKEKIVKSKYVWLLFCDEQLVLEIIGFNIWRYLAKWFWIYVIFRWWIVLCLTVWSSQTGWTRPVRLACVGRSDRLAWRFDCPALCWFRFWFFYLDTRDYFIFITSRWILCICNTVVC